MEEEKKEIDWSILKTSLILFCMCLLISISLIASSYYFNNKLEKEYANNKKVFQSISRRYLDVDQEEKLLRDFYPKFLKLYSNGAIGRERRLNWIEALREAGEKNSLPALNYAIKSQEEYKPGYQINYSGYKLYRSNMELKLGLLHEGDLFKLINYLNKTAKGIYTISECDFKLNGQEIKFDKNASNISVNCLLHWITIDLPDGKGIELG